MEAANQFQRGSRLQITEHSRYAGMMRQVKPTHSITRKWYIYGQRIIIIALIIIALRSETLCIFDLYIWRF